MAVSVVCLVDGTLVGKVDGLVVDMEVSILVGTVTNSVTVVCSS